MTSLDTASLFLFVPADRPERCRKALGAGADAVILDLEDAVAPEARAAARAALFGARDVLSASPCPVLVRINPLSGCGELDVATVSSLPVAGVVVPKAESADELRTLSARLQRPVVALIESARGLAAARALAGACARLGFGSIDFAADMGCRHTRSALLAARSELVMASRLAGRPAPVDGVTNAIRDAELVRNEAAYAAELGFAGKLLIHPAQIGPAAEGFAPTDEEKAWARQVLSWEQAEGAAKVDGAMVDAPVRQLAKQILARAGRQPGCPIAAAQPRDAGALGKQPR